ncbi:T9SS type A sorting domain-containing protein [Salinibacter sp.]|uniref:T9SS type A sorting domain-containing protein n=1 Tax=Salinibacter sp. TaxID=2065818 RepID=UPI0021E8CD96|nr:T9SS type A sorting domain-containing protein [Salinibacter sp.]
MNRIAIVVVLLGGLLGLAPLGALGQAGSGSLQSIGLLNVERADPAALRAARAGMAGPDDTGKDGPLSAVGMELAVLYHQQQVGGAASVQALRGGARQRPKTRGGDPQSRAPAQSPSSMGRTLSPVSSDGRSVTVDAVASGDPSRLLQDLRALGLEGESSAGNVVSGRLPIAAIEEAAALPSLRGMMPAYARTTAGSVGSEADTAHAATAARRNTGTDGSGQKVCALSDSYDTADAATSAADDVQSGDLPGQNNPEGRTTPVDVLEEYDGTDPDDPEPTDEGRAMLQLIHDIAPGAALGFHTAFGGLGVFASGIRELADAGCTVIVDDVRYSTEPFYQDGLVANAIDDVVSNDGVAYFSSAGNDGQNSYEAPFRDSGEPGVIDPSSVRHDFDDSALSTDTRQEVTIQSGGTFQVFSFQWTDPSAVVEGSDGPDTDLDIALVDEAGTVVAQSASDNLSTGVPAETMEYTNDGSTAETLHLVIEKAAGPNPDEIKYVYSGSGPFTDSDVTIEEYDTLGPTVYGHPMAEGAMAVAAAPFFNTAAYNPNADPATLEAFSSKGGLQIRFDQSGDRLSTPQDREKPDVTGTDGVDNTFFGSDIGDSFFDGVDADPHPNFFGTSAAAPNIAAIGALIRQARPGLTPSEVYSRLEDTAADVTSRASRDGGFVSVASGPDPWSGHGFVQAEPAVPAVDVAITNASGEGQATGGGNGAVDLTWRQVGGEEDVTLDAFVIQQGYFGSGLADRVRIPSNGAGDYSRTLKDLPVGTHRFRILGVTESSAGTDSLVTQSRTQVTLRRSDVTATAYPNPFRDALRLSITFPEGREAQPVRVDVYDVLGRRVATPVLSREVDGSASIDLSGQLPRSLGSGTYFFRVWNEDFAATTKAVHVR